MTEPGPGRGCSTRSINGYVAGCQGHVGRSGVRTAAGPANVEANGPHRHRGCAGEQTGRAAGDPVRPEGNLPGGLDLEIADARRSARRRVLGLISKTSAVGASQQKAGGAPSPAGPPQHLKQGQRLHLTPTRDRLAPARTKPNRICFVVHPEQHFAIMTAFGIDGAGTCSGPSPLRLMGR